MPLLFAMVSADFPLSPAGTFLRRVTSIVFRPNRKHAPRKPSADDPAVPEEFLDLYDAPSADIAFFLPSAEQITNAAATIYAVAPYSLSRSRTSAHQSMSRREIVVQPAGHHRFRHSLPDILCRRTRRRPHQYTLPVQASEVANALDRWLVSGRADPFSEHRKPDGGAVRPEGATLEHVARASLTVRKTSFR